MLSITASVGQNKIIVQNFETLKLMIRYNPNNVRSLQEGFYFGEPVLNERNIMLYPPGREINQQVIERLAQLQETNSNFRPVFAIQKNVTLIAHFREDIVKDIRRLIETKKRRDRYANFLTEIEKSLDFYLEELLKSEDIVYILSQMKLRDQQLSQGDETSRQPYFNHSINTLLYALGIGKNSYKHNNFKYNNFIELAKTAMFHNINVFENIDAIKDLQKEALIRKYFEMNLQSHILLQNLNLEDDIIQAVKKANEYYIGSKGFVTNTDISSTYANIVLVADMFDKWDSGFLVEKKSTQDAIDVLYTHASSDELRRIFVDALAQGLKLKPLVDFYAELDRLRSECFLKKGNEFAIPYPMTGFQSAIVFICKDRSLKCPFRGATKSITIFKTMKDVKPGSYPICIKMTSGLREFYASHYQDIKEITRAQEDEEQ